MSQQHTATPWSRNIKPAAKYNCIFSGRNTHVLYLATSGMPPEEVEANCEFLLQTVNSHDALVAALEACQIRLFMLDGAGDEYSAAAAALKLAKGE